MARKVDGGRWYGGWYDNPATGKNQRYWGNGVWTNGEEPGAATSSSSTSSFVDNSPAAWAKAYADSAAEVAKDQVNFTKEFLEKNPLAFDEALAKESSKQRLQPYYKQLLDDFTQDVEVKKRRSVEDESALVTELTRSKEFTVGKASREYQLAREKAREGFAGSGLFFSGLAKRSEGQQEVANNEEISNFTAETASKIGRVQAGGRQEREEDLLPGELSSLERRNRDLFGDGTQTGEFGEQVTLDVERQRQIAESQRQARALAAVSAKYGQPVQGVNNFLSGVYA